MSGIEDHLDKKFSELADPDRKEIPKIYQAYGKYYTDILRNMDDKILNWAFTLNTGGLAVTITFMGANIKWSLAGQPKLFWLILIIIFALGILSAVTAAFSQHNRFWKKGDLLDKQFNQYQQEEITASVFLKFLPPKIVWLDCLVPKFEITSYLLFFIGLITSACILMST